VGSFCLSGGDCHQYSRLTVRTGIPGLHPVPMVSLLAIFAFHGSQPAAPGIDTDKTGPVVSNLPRQGFGYDSGPGVAPGTGRRFGGFGHEGAYAGSAACVRNAIIQGTPNISKEVPEHEKSVADDGHTHK